MKQKAYSLMKRWCDKLLTYEIHLPDKNVDGGLICPACHVIHGRIGDLIYPLVTLYAHENNPEYLNAAKRFIDFTEHNLIRPDGGYRNDLGCSWKGISAFSALSIGDTLLEFGDRLPAELYEKWMRIFIRLSEFTLRFFETTTPNINYYAGASAELALAYNFTGREEFLDESKRWERYCHKHFDESGLFYGEIHGIDHLSERGCRGIDFGYDLEESLPLLLRQAVLTGNQKNLEFYKARLIDHFDFLLPDGAIDNSAGTRQNKWTYWGSRTSDGLLEGLALICDEPIFARAAKKVLALYESCTHDDLLSLPMADDAGEPTCLHHSFCHAKALAAFVNSKTDIADPDNASLPLESPRGVRAYQNGNLLCVSVGSFRATFSSVDIAYLKGSETSGGSMTLLWNEDYGPVCASTTQNYIPSEPYNMQYLRHAESSPCMTPHIIIDGKSSVLDGSAILGYSGDKDDATVNASGKGWRIDYHFGKDLLSLTIRTERNAAFLLPIIAGKDIPLAVDEKSLRVGSLSLSSDHAIAADAKKRTFHQVGGFCYIPVKLDIPRDEEVTIRIKVNAREKNEN